MGREGKRKKWKSRKELNRNLNEHTGVKKKTRTK